ncbi:MAG: hypothetical protein FJ150_00775 [Euryarchaeota archaeon]|nr:hypothetical protein [Euryarchaeota archaeon]
MIILTQKENLVFNQIKYLQIEFGTGVTYKILKFDLDIPEIELKEILENLEKKELIFITDDNKIKAKTKEFEIKVRPSGEIEEKNKKVNLEKIKLNEIKIDKERINKRKYRQVENLNQTEKDALKIIKEVADDNGLMSKYFLEGNLLYGNLKLSNLKMSKLIMALEGKRLIKKVQRKDGECYSLLI